MVPTLLLFIACGDDEEQDSGETPAAATTPARSPTRTAATSTANALEDVCAENPDPAGDDTNQVDEPAEGDEVSSPLTVRGQIAAFEATFKVTLFDEDGNQIADLTGMSAEGQTLAPYEEELTFSVTEETPACLWVYEASARDGLPVNVVQIPVVLLP